MELKWLEDLITVSKMGHFARAAEARYITQSALSRRIQSLENWAGAELLDRTQHPIRLTAAGEKFMPGAQTIVKEAYEAQAAATNFARLARSGITFACLHTLALVQIPRFIGKLQKLNGSFEAAIVSETRTIEDFLYGLRNGSCDFFVSYDHPGILFDIDSKAYPRLCVGKDLLVPVARDPALFDLFDPACEEEIPYLEYGPTSIMSRVIRHMLQKAPFAHRLRTTYRATLAESLGTAAGNGLGIAWLPESLVHRLGPMERLEVYRKDFITELDIQIFKSKMNERPIVNRIWNQLSTHCNNNDVYFMHEQSPQ